MPVPILHIFCPREERLPGIGQWRADLAALFKGDVTWNNCVVRVVEYDAQAAFDVPTESDFIRRNPGPIILLQKVQKRYRERLDAFVGRTVSVHVTEVTCVEDLWQICDIARLQYEGGEPKVPLREALAYLIVRKLERLGKWGGTSLNKNFLRSPDLPKGGFPKDILVPSEILDIAEQLVRFNVLTAKTGDNERKYALAGVELVQSILDTKSFASHPEHFGLRNFFERDSTRVTVRTLDYKD